MGREQEEGREVIEENSESGRQTAREEVEQWRPPSDFGTIHV